MNDRRPSTALALSRCRLVLAGLCLLLAVSEVCAGGGTVRALMRFDAQGHRLVRLVPGAALRAGAAVGARAGQNRQTAWQIARKLAVERSRGGKLSAAAPGVRAAVPTVSWIGPSGAVLLTDTFSDPRLTHAPQGIDQASALEYAVRESGAYLLTGPADAVELRIGFPAIELAERMTPAEFQVVRLRQP